MFKMSFDGIGKLVIYGGGQIKLVKTRDLNKVSITEGKEEHTSGKVYFYLSEAPKNARKENLNRKDCYFLNYTDDHSGYWKERKTALYIHESEISVTDLGEYVAADHNGERDFLFRYSLNFKNGYEYRKINCERMLVEKSWTLPEGARWYRLGDYNNTYDVSEPNELYKKLHPEAPDYNLVHWTLSTEKSFVNYVSSEGYHRIEKTEERKERETLAAVLAKALNKTVSEYDVKRLLEVVNIEVKPEAVKA